MSPTGAKRTELLNIDYFVKADLGKYGKVWLAGHWVGVGAVAALVRPRGRWEGTLHR